MSLEYIRDSKKTIYVSRDVWRGLWLLSRAKEKSPDELADEWLRTIIHNEYPYLIEFQNEVSKMERKIIKQIGGQPPNDAHT